MVTISTNSNSSTKDEIVKDYLWKPVHELPDFILRIRKILISISAAAFFFKTYDLQLNNDGKIFGLHFNNLDNIKIDHILFVIISYNLIHFIVSIVEYINYSRLRITGTNLKPINSLKFGPEGGDDPDDPKQSTLYSWWSQESHHLKGIDNMASTVSQCVEEIGAFKNKYTEYDPTVYPEFREEVNRIEGILRSISGGLEKLRTTISSSRIRDSLKKFDNWFKSFRKIQWFRLIFLEISIPLFLALYCLVMLDKPYPINMVTSYLSAMKIPVEAFRIKTNFKTEK